MDPNGPKWTLNIKEFYNIWDFLVRKYIFFQKTENFKNAQKRKNFEKNAVFSAFFAKKTVGHHYFFCVFLLLIMYWTQKKVQIGPNLLFLGVSHKTVLMCVFLL